MAYLSRLLVRVWVFALFGAVFLMLLVWSLISGKRPVAFVQFSNMLRASKDFRDASWPPTGGHPKHPNADVVDVQAREVHSALQDHR